MNNLLLDVENSNSWVLFFFVIMVLAGVSYLFNFLIVNDELYYSYLENQLSYERIEEMLYSKEKWSLISYSLIPLFFFLKFGMITIILLTGLFMFNFKIEIKRIFKIVIISELVFLVPLLIKMFWFSFIQTDYTLEDIQFFSPLSLLSFFNADEVEIWWVYSLKTLNVFEAIYWLVLTFFLIKITKETFDRMLGLVLSSYGVSLVIWVVFITFLTVSVGG